MRIIIIGGGKVGYHLAKTLASDKHKITVIELEQGICGKISHPLHSLGIELINGDGTDINLLQEAEIGDADLLIAVTGQDQDNLVACQLAKTFFGVPRTIARVNNPKNIAVFMQLGVDSVVSSTAHIADIIETEVDWAGINRRLAKKLGHVRIREFHVGRDAKTANKRIADLNLPKETIFIAVLRGSEAIVPDGRTVIQKDDDVIVLSSDVNMKDLAAYF